MDRILRPNGYAIIRESSYFADTIASVAKELRWSCRKEKTESESESEKLLICQKKLWFSSNSTSETKQKKRGTNQKLKLKAFVLSGGFLRTKSQQQPQVLCLSSNPRKVFKAFYYPSIFVSTFDSFLQYTICLVRNILLIFYFYLNCNFILNV